MVVSFMVVSLLVGLVVIRFDRTAAPDLIGRSRVRPADSFRTLPNTGRTSAMSYS